MSPSVASIVVIVAAVPTISVMIPAVILTFLRSAVSVSKVGIVPTPDTSMFALISSLLLNVDTPDTIKSLFASISPVIVSAPPTLIS